MDSELDVIPNNAELFQGLSRGLGSSRNREGFRSTRFSPGLSYGRHFGPAGPAAKNAAVLVAMHGVPGTAWPSWTIPLTVRTAHLADHPGQISLPGGRLEEGETFQEAAESENCEELGVESFPGKILGELEPVYVYHSDYYVIPYVGFVDSRPEFRPCSFEVERVLELPVAKVCDSDAVEQHTFVRGKAEWPAPAIRSDRDLIWGATAIILGEFAGLIEQVLRRYLQRETKRNRFAAQ